MYSFTDSFPSRSNVGSSLWNDRAEQPIRSGCLLAPASSEAIDTPARPASPKPAAVRKHWRRVKVLGGGVASALSVKIDFRGNCSRGSQLS